MTDNPKDAPGRAKASISAVPMPVLAELGVQMAEGAAKYGRHNWRAAPVVASVYVDAAFRHLAAWFEGENVDPRSASGCSHLVAAMASLAVLRDAQLTGTMVDDRPPGEAGFLEALAPAVAAIAAQYPDPPPPVMAAKQEEPSP